MKNVILRKNDTRFFQGKLVWKTQFRDGMNLVFWKKIQFCKKKNMLDLWEEDYNEKCNFAQK